MGKYPYKKENYGTLTGSQPLVGQFAGELLADSSARPCRRSDRVGFQARPPCTERPPLPRRRSGP